MAQNEIVLSGISVSKNVVSTIVTLAAQKAEGVASVGGNDIASNLISVFTRKKTSPEQAVTCEVEGDKLKVCVHLAVFYGYPFTRLAADVRNDVASAVEEQIGVGVSSVDVCIDSLVFPKE